MPAGWGKKAAEDSTNTNLMEDARPPYRQFQNGAQFENTNRSRHLLPGGRAGSMCGNSRRKVWRLVANRALRARGNYAARRASTPATLAMDAARGRIRSAGPTRRLCHAHRKTVSRADLRIVSRLPDGNCRRVRRSDCEK